MLSQDGPLSSASGRSTFTNMSPIDAENNRRRALSMGSPSILSPLNLTSLQQGARDLSLPEENMLSPSSNIVLGPVTTHKSVPPDLKLHMSPRFGYRNRSANNSNANNYVTSSPSSTSFDYSSDTGTDDVIFGSGASLSSKQLRMLFPYHIVINQDFNVIQMGSQMSTLLRKKTNISKGLTYEHIGKYFRIVQPHSYPWDWKTLGMMREATVELELSKDFMPGQSGAAAAAAASSPQRPSQMLLPPSSNSDSSSGRSSPSQSFVYSFIGTVQVMNPRDDNDLLMPQAVFILHPHIKDTATLRKWEMKISDLSRQGFHKELIESSEKLNMASDEISKLQEEKLKLQEEITKLKKESNATEMRHMIANVAHDLKTPLSAFLGAVELVDMALQTVKPSISRIAEKSNTAAYIDQMNNICDGVESAQASLTNMRDINNFMTMTINRCIDYTKASQGLKLVPKFETIDLAEVLLLPMNCMQAMQSKMKIDLLPISDEICTHIITDKQWMQENLLCLLSNAVKYSHEGSITVNIYLHPSAGGEDAFSTALTMKQGQIISQQQQVRPQHRHSFGVASTSSKFGGGATPLTRVRSDSEEEGSTTGRNSFSYPSSPMSAATPLTHPVADGGSKSEKAVSETATGPAAVGLTTLQHRLSLSKTSFAEKLIAKGLTMLDTCIEPATGAQRNPMLPPPLLMIEVEDTGIGLTEEAMENLFNPFQQAQRLAGGTGLGLYSLAKRLDALNGFYGVDKRRDGKSGSMFWFAFPYRPDHEFARSKPVRHLSKLNIDWIEKERERFVEQEQADNAIKLSPKFDGCSSRIGNSSDRSLQILLVDDSSPILKMTTAMLRRQGHKIDQAENGAEAVKKVTTKLATGLPYDCILMDLIMPVMDGLEATRRIREIEQKSNNAVFRNAIICVSANSDDDTIEGILEAGADEFMCKPFSLQNFHEAYLRTCGFHTVG